MSVQNTAGSSVSSRRVLHVIGTIFLICFLAAVIYGCIFILYVKTELMSEVGVSMDDLNMKLSSTVYYQDSETGEYLEYVTLESSEKRTWIDYENIPKYFEHAVVAIEDKRFYKHHGVDWFRTTTAFFNMFLGMKNTYGGSTITQQLIKNVTGYNDDTVRRKILEIFRAIEFEQKYDKWQIIEWYLNAVYFGHGQNGIVSAAEYYFGKTVDQLSLAEIACIVGITNNPSLYSPYSYPENNKNRQELILGEMLDQGYISQEEHNAAVAEELHFVESHSSGNDSMTAETHYDYFVDALIEDVIADLMEVKNLSYDMAETLLLTGGYKIYATVDKDIQTKIDDIYSDSSKVPQSRNSKLLQSAVVVIDPFTGNIVGLRGGVGVKEGDRVLNRATGTLRPPGSSLKPLAVYAPAMEAGLITPNTKFEDSADVKLNGTSWLPKNDDRQYHGVLTINEAVCQSINTIAAQVMDLLTPQKSYEFLTEKIGFKNLLEYRDGASDIDYAPLALGQLTDGITVREMASGYTMFVNGGVWTESRTYTAIYDSDDNLVYENKPETTQAISEKTAYWMTYMLQNATSYGTGTTARLRNMPTAGKTGTSSNTQDRWYCGYTPYYVAAVWSGYDTPSTLAVSGNPSAKLFNLVMTAIHEDLPRKDFNKPSDTSLPSVPGVSSVDYTVVGVDLFGKVLYTESFEGVVGKTYEVEVPSVDGYKTVETSKSITLTDNPENNVVTFLFFTEGQDPNNPQIAYTIRCVDESGNVIQTSTGYGTPNSPCTVTAPSIAGYELTSSPSIVINLTTTPENNVATFSYKKSAVDPPPVDPDTPDPDTPPAA